MKSHKYTLKQTFWIQKPTRFRVIDLIYLILIFTFNIDPKWTTLSSFILHLTSECISTCLWSDMPLVIWHQFSTLYANKHLYYSVCKDLLKCVLTETHFLCESVQTEFPELLVEPVIYLCLPFEMFKHWGQGSLCYLSARIGTHFHLCRRYPCPGISSWSFSVAQDTCSFTLTDECHHKQLPPVSHSYVLGVFTHRAVQGPGYSLVTGDTSAETAPAYSPCWESDVCCDSPWECSSTSSDDHVLDGLLSHLTALLHIIITCGCVWNLTGKLLLG